MNIFQNASNPSAYDTCEGILLISGITVTRSVSAMAQTTNCTNRERHDCVSRTSPVMHQWMEYRKNARSNYMFSELQWAGSVESAFVQDNSDWCVAAATWRQRRFRRLDFSSDSQIIFETLKPDKCPQLQLCVADISARSAANLQTTTESHTESISN